MAGGPLPPLRIGSSCIDNHQAQDSLQWSLELMIYENPEITLLSCRHLSETMALATARQEAGR